MTDKTVKIRTLKNRIQREKNIRWIERSIYHKTSEDRQGEIPVYREATKQRKLTGCVI